MSKVLNLYEEILNSNQRFVDEVFVNETYRAAVPQLTIIDAGAYEGEFSFYCYNFAKNIYAFEPDPRPYEILRDRVNKYELKKIKVYKEALAAETGERIFHASGHGGSRLLEENQEEHPKEDKIKVPTISLKDLFEKEKINQVDIFKIDIEGGEYEIFSDPEFKKLAPKIKLIIGEHLHNVDPDLKALGYKIIAEEDSNTTYVRD